MALFFVDHSHNADTCPTKNREMMLMLGQHVTQQNADAFGITIRSDIVHPGEHRMMMVLEAESRDVDRDVELDDLPDAQVAVASPGTVQSPS